MIIVEYSKVSKTLGIIKAGLYVNHQLFCEGRMADDITELTEESYDWSKLKIGDTRHNAFSLDFPKKKLLSQIKEGFNTSIRKGRLPFIPK